MGYTSTKYVFKQREWSRERTFLCYCGLEIAWLVLFNWMLNARVGWHQECSVEAIQTKSKSYRFCMCTKISTVSGRASSDYAFFDTRWKSSLRTSGDQSNYLGIVTKATHAIFTSIYFSSLCDTSRFVCTTFLLARPAFLSKFYPESICTEYL